MQVNNMTSEYILVRYNKLDAEQTLRADQLREIFSQNASDVELKLENHNAAFVEARLFRNNRSFILLHSADVSVSDALKRYNSAINL